MKKRKKKLVSRALNHVDDVFRHLASLLSSLASSNFRFGGVPAIDLSESIYKLLYGVFSVGFTGGGREVQEDVHQEGV